MTAPLNDPVEWERIWWAIPLLAVSIAVGHLLREVSQLAGRIERIESISDAIRSDAQSSHDVDRIGLLRSLLQINAALQPRSTEADTNVGTSLKS